MARIVIRENARHGTSRDPVASTVSAGSSNGDTNSPALESRRQRRALRGPKGFGTATTSRVRDAWATPVVIVKAGRGQRRKAYRDGLTTTLNLGGSTPCDYVYGTG